MRRPRQIPGLNWNNTMNSSKALPAYTNFSALLRQPVRVRTSLLESLSQRQLQLGLERRIILKVNTHPLVRGATSTSTDRNQQQIRGNICVNTPAMHALDPSLDVGSNFLREGPGEAFHAKAHHKILQRPFVSVFSEHNSHNPKRTAEVGPSPPANQSPFFARCPSIYRNIYISAAALVNERVERSVQT